MKKTLLILILVGLIQSIYAQELSLELNQYSDPIELGKNARYNLVLTNNTNEDIILFYSPMSDYGVGGFEYTISCNGNQILHRSTDGSDTNEGFGENRIGKLPPGESKTILGLRSFPLNEAGKYDIQITYYQDPSGLVDRWAENKKAKKSAQGITKFNVKLNETIEVE